jgi:hypothetical protein
VQVLVTAAPSMPEPLAEPPSTPPKKSRPLAEPRFDSVPSFLTENEHLAAEHADTEITRIVRRDQVGERFVLQFSTGESHVVWGSGLVGRNPTPEPGEQFTHQISIVDPGKSVSKTHLEFGQTAGAFWICDRFSGNGTEIRQPDSAQQRCDAGKRYLLARGSRIDIGDQFFVVS